MARVTPADLARLEQEAATAKAAFAVKVTRVRRAAAAAGHARTGAPPAPEALRVTASGVETLHGPRTALAQPPQAAQTAEPSQAPGALPGSRSAVGARGAAWCSAGSSSPPC